MKDSIILSLLRGRLGAALLSLLVALAAIYEIDISPEVKEGLIAGGASIAAILATISKTREK